MAEKGELNGRHVLAMVVAFFSVMIAANIIFIRAAVTTFPGVSEDKSYILGVHFNDALAERTVQAELGWTAEIREVMREGETGRILLLMTKEKTPLNNLSVTGVLKRPVHDSADQTLVFAALGGGLYMAEASAFSPGVWDLALRVENRLGDALDVDARVIAP